MSKKEEPNLSKQYLDAVTKKIKAAQDNNEVPSTYVFTNKGKKWVLMLPRSVMEQKRLMHLRNDYLMQNSYETEVALLGAMLENSTVDGHSVALSDLEYDEIEVFRTAYLDGLLLPLSLGGDKSVGEYMMTVINHQ